MERRRQARQLFVRLQRLSAKKPRIIPSAWQSPGILSLSATCKPGIFPRRRSRDEPALGRWDEFGSLVWTKCSFRAGKYSEVSIAFLRPEPTAQFSARIQRVVGQEWLGIDRPLGA
jgi:hypothetical protein